jgi:chitinase
MRLTRVLVVLCSVVLFVPASPAGASVSRWVLGYYVGYLRDALPPAQVPWSGMTHIVVGPVTPRADGTLDTTLDIDATHGPALARQLARGATAHGVTPMLMIGGAGAQAAFRGAMSAHPVAFENRLLQKLTAWGYAGLDLDWEPVDTADQPLISRLVGDLRAAMPGLVLTMPVGWVNPNYQTVPAFYAQLATKLDRLDIMTYGMAGAYGGWKSWHSSALHGATPSTPAAVDTSVQLYESAGVPAGKLGVGVGFYGSCWTAPVTGPSQTIAGSTIVADDNVMSFTNIMATYWSAGASRYDTAAEAPYLTWSAPHGPKGCTFVSYENSRSVTAKGQWAAANGLGAEIVWNINEGHNLTAPAGTRDALLHVVRTSFGA